MKGETIVEDIQKEVEVEVDKSRDRSDEEILNHRQTLCEVGGDLTPTGSGGGSSLKKRKLKKKHRAIKLKRSLEDGVHSSAETGDTVFGDEIDKLFGDGSSGFDYDALLGEDSMLGDKTAQVSSPAASEQPDLDENVGRKLVSESGHGSEDDGDGIGEVGGVEAVVSAVEVGVGSSRKRDSDSGDHSRKLKKSRLDRASAVSNVARRLKKSLTKRKNVSLTGGLKRKMLSSQPEKNVVVYDPSSDEEEIRDPASGKNKVGIGYLFPTAPKAMMHSFLTADDLNKLGRCKLTRKIKKLEKHAARVSDVCYSTCASLSFYDDSFLACLFLAYMVLYIFLVVLRRVAYVLTFLIIYIFYDSMLDTVSGWQWMLFVLDLNAKRMCNGPMPFMQRHKHWSRSCPS